MITNYSHTNIKGTSCDIVVGPVTLFVGRNRSSKTAKMLGIQLAATGSCPVGTRRDKLAPLVSKGETKASSILWHNAIGLSRWTFDDKKCGGLRDMDFGTLLTADDFWKLTGEEKWTTISDLVPATVNAELMARLKALPHGGAPSDGPSLAEAIQSNIANQQQAAEAALKNLSASLQPPEPYTGEPLAQLNTKRQELEQLIADQKKAKAYWDGRPDYDVEIAKRNAAIETATADHNATVEQMAKLQALRPQALELATKLGDRFCKEPTTLRRCRTERPCDVIPNAFREAVDQLLDVIGAMSAIKPRELNCDDELTCILRGVETMIEDDFAGITEPIDPPEEFQLLRELFVDFPTIGNQITDLENGMHVVNHVDYAMSILGKEILRLSGQITGMVQHASLYEQERNAEPLYPKPMTMDELTAKVSGLDAIQKQILRAQEWPAFEMKQKVAAQKIEELRQQLATLKLQAEEVRTIRAEILKASIGPVEDEANRMLTEMGLSTLKIRVESKGRFSTLSVEDNSGVDLSAMCGAEKVIYGYALLCAIHQVSPVKCPVRLIEAAELDSQSLTDLLKCLVKLNHRGNTFIATHVQPTETVEGVTVVPC